MPEEPTVDILQQVLANVLEEAAFVFTEPLNQRPDWPAGLIQAELVFAGPRRGTLLLAAPRAFAIELAANLLGVDPGDPSIQSKAQDAVGEILNIVAGAMMPEVFGEEALCDLGLPLTREASAEEYESRLGSASAGTCLLAEEVHRIDLSYFAA